MRVSRGDRVSLAVSCGGRAARPKLHQGSRGSKAHTRRCWRFQALALDRFQWPKSQVKFLSSALGSLGANRIGMPFLIAQMVASVRAQLFMLALAAQGYSGTLVCQPIELTVHGDPFIQGIVCAEPGPSTKEFVCDWVDGCWWW